MVGHTQYHPCHSRTEQIDAGGSLLDASCSRQYMTKYYLTGNRGDDSRADDERNIERQRPGGKCAGSVNLNGYS